MKKFFKIIIYLKFFIFLINCSGGWGDFKKTMSGQKTTNTDEFLIKKKDPLVLPPEYGELPFTKSIKKISRSFNWKIFWDQMIILKMKQRLHLI